MRKPVNFFCFAPQAGSVAVVGDFNDWSPSVHPMRRGPDGAWTIQIPLSHGHHQYLYLVDGRKELDPRAQGVGRTESNERVSIVAVS